MSDRAGFDPEAFYMVSREIVVHSQTEGTLRTSIGRAYYACHHLAVVALQRKWSWQVPPDGRHRAVVRALEHFQRTVPRRQFPNSLAAKLEALLALREEADYDLDVQVTPARQREAAELAEELVRRLKALANVRRSP